MLDTFASRFEFQHRTWFIFGIFRVGLACYWIDPQASGLILGKALRSHIALLQKLGLETSIRIIFLIGAFVVAVGGILRA